MPEDFQTALASGALEEVTINTDDYLVFGRSVSEEFLALYCAGKFTAAELDQIRLSACAMIERGGNRRELPLSPAWLATTHRNFCARALVKRAP
jgi:hypothetical protein